MNCLDCNLKLINCHANTKRCQSCGELKRRYPNHSLSEMQKNQVFELAGTMFQWELAEHIGVSRTNLIRFASSVNLSLNHHKYKKSVADEVCKYYCDHGKAKTKKKFPDVKLRSIIERYYKELGLPARQERWTDDQFIDLIKMAGIVSFEKQANYFNRPGANLGSIRSAWSKKIKASGRNINGISHSVAKFYVKDNCPMLEVDFLVCKRKNSDTRKIALWVDVEKYLKPEIPEHLKSAISTLAKFQRWVQGRNVKYNIKKMIERRNNE